MRYHKVGTALQDSFIYLDKSTRLPVTGKTNASFTKQISKNATGGVSTTGCTITETSSSTNAGDYDFAVDLSTGFVAATGEYTVVIFDTASPEYRWSETYVVTSDGTGTGTIGSASFTATAANGRVTDGTSALQDAVVRIRNAANAILYSFTTTAAGLWGPVYLDPGTYTIDVQKSGYTASTAYTIVVVSSTATGPLVDIALTNVSSGTGLTASDLWAYARRLIRDKIGLKADTEVKQGVNSALDMISKEKTWDWYKTHGVVTLQAPYATGTITLTNGSTTATFSGATLPSWAASGKLKYGGNVLRISTRDSATQLTLAVAWQEATASAQGYILFQDEYTLPSDCMRFGRLFAGERWGYGGTATGFEDLLERQSRQTFTQQIPGLWAIYRGKIIVWPYPSQALNENMIYLRKPAAMTSSADEADWDPMHVEVLHRAIDYQMSIRYEDCAAGKPTDCFSRYQAALARASVNDKTTMHRDQIMGTGVLSRMGSVSDRLIPAS